MQCDPELSQRGYGGGVAAAWSPSTSFGLGSDWGLSANGQEACGVVVHGKTNDAETAFDAIAETAFDAITETAFDAM